MAFKSARLIPDPDPTDVGWYDDASTSYGIGLLIGKQWGQLKIKNTARDDPRCDDIAWLEKNDDIQKTDDNAKFGKLLGTMYKQCSSL